MNGRKFDKFSGFFSGHHNGEWFNFFRHCADPHRGPHNPPPPPGFGHHPPPPPPHPPFGRGWSFLYPFEIFGGRLPINRESMKELKHFIVLNILAGKNGITGYELQQKYGFSRGGILKTLDELESRGLITSSTRIEKGRNLKLYYITEKGREYLGKLIERWSVIFTAFSDMVPPNPEIYLPGSAFMKERVLKKLETFTDKEDAVDYLGGLRYFLKRKLEYLEKKKSIIQKSIRQLDRIIKTISEQAEYNPDAVKSEIDPTQPED